MLKVKPNALAEQGDACNTMQYHGFKLPFPLHTRYTCCCCNTTTSIVAAATAHSHCTATSTKAATRMAPIEK